MLLDVNSKRFGLVADKLNERSITPPDCSPKIPHLGEEDYNVLQELLLAFGLGNNYMVQSNILHKKPNLGQANDSSNNHSK